MPKEAFKIITLRTILESFHFAEVKIFNMGGKIVMKCYQ